MMKKLIPILVIFGLLLPSFSLINSPPVSFAQIEPPETLEGAKEMGEEALETTQKELPGILEKTWKEEVLPVWQKMYRWFEINIWAKIKSWFKNEVAPRVKEEIEKRKPIIEEEFEKEKEETKEEIKEELPKIGKSLWERFKELIR